MKKKIAISDMLFNRASKHLIACSKTYASFLMHDHLERILYYVKKKICSCTCLIITITIKFVTEEPTILSMSEAGGCTLDRKKLW